MTDPKPTPLDGAGNAGNAERNGWTVVLADGSTVTIDATEVTTRDGSLWLLAETPPPAPLRVVLVLARGRWHAAYPANTDPLPPMTQPVKATPRAL